jgi:hypothetical protein
LVPFGEELQLQQNKISRRRKKRGRRRKRRGKKSWKKTTMVGAWSFAAPSP